MKGKLVTSIAAALLVGAAACAMNAATAAQFRGGGGGFHGGGGGHFGGGGGHFGGGGGHFGGGGMHFGGGGMHFGGGGMHFGGGGMHFGGGGFGARSTHFASPHFATRHFGAPTGNFAQRNGVVQGAANAGHPAAGPNVAGHDVVGSGAGQNHAMANAGANTFAGGHDARAFHHGQFGWRDFHRGFVGWGGPVFWPYAYDDLFDYAYWPYDDYGPYGDLFWAYGYDDLFAGVLLPYDYANFYGYGSPEPATFQQQNAPLPASSVAQLCGSAPVSGASPIDRIANVVQPNPDQRAKLEALGQAEASADKELRASCTTQMPTTAVGRLDAVQKRLQDMLAAVNTVGGPLGEFYSSLTDEQKARFNALAAGQPARNQGAAQSASLAEVCGPQNAIPVVSVGQIDKAVQPNLQQRAEVIALRDAANKADDIVLASCPKEAPLTPPAKLDAARDRLQAMLQAIQIVSPVLQSFYASLSPEQKARFDAMGVEAPSGQQGAKS